ncbi:MAG: FAD:protein FMN transferase [Pseudomonadota bacterium]
MLTRRTILMLPLGLMACKEGLSVVELTGTTMGTTYRLVALDRSGAVDREALNSSLQIALADVNAAMSNWDPTSEVSRLNSSTDGTATAASGAMMQVLHAASDVQIGSNGAFDVTVGALVDLWGFGAQGGAGEAPSDAAIDATMAHVGQDTVLRLTSNTVAKTAPAVSLYLSAIGKGYGVDLIAAAVEAEGITDYMIEIGGDLYAAGQNADGQTWQIGIETPDATDRRVQTIAGVSGGGMATSGDYRNYFEVDGTRYSHILDPRTGRPITHRTASATVITENAMLADAWATAMLVLGREEGMEIAAANELPVLFIDRDGADFVTFRSPAFERLG